MKISISHKGYDWLIHVLDYDYEEAEQGVQPSLSNPGEPSYPESACITDGYLQLDGEGELSDSINAQLYERGEGSLFNTLVELNQEDIEATLLEHVHAEQESQARDYEAEAEEAEVEQREEFKNREARL